MQTQIQAILDESMKDIADLIVLKRDLEQYIKVKRQEKEALSIQIWKENQLTTKYEGEIRGQLEITPRLFKGIQQLEEEIMEVKG